MLRKLGHFTVLRRRWIMVGTLIFVVLGGVVGGGVADELSSGGFDDPAAESFLADKALDRVFASGNPNLVLLVTARFGSVDDEEVAAFGAELTRRLQAEEGIEQAVSYWTLGSPPPLASTAGDQALVLARVEGTQDQILERTEALTPDYRVENDIAKVDVGGQAAVFVEVGETIEGDLARAEAISFPVTLVLLILVFGSVVAAGLPLGVGIVSVLGTFLVLRVLASMTEVSIYALNLTTAMGLGLAIDYSLFIVSRFREEMRAGLAPDDAVVRSVETAGRTVLFSAVTVAVSLAALFVFPLPFLRSFAYAGVAVVAMAAFGSVVALPAVLASLGPRVDIWRLWGRRPDAEGAFWHRLATTVMRRPVPAALAVIAVLLVLGAPFLGVEFGLPDDRVLPPDADSRTVQDEIRSNFSSRESDTLPVVALGTGPASGYREELERYAAELSAVENVARVDALTGSYIGGQLAAPANEAAVRFANENATWLSVVPQVEAVSREAEKLVHDLRRVDAPFEVMVGGPSAQLVDSKESIFGRMPLAAALIGGVTLVVLFLMFGSVLVPLKAVVLNMLSLSATFGAMVWIFQEGHLAGFLNFTPTGALDTTTPILMFCVAFGLSMDYEVFLLSRIKEEHDRSGLNEHSVATGLEKTGRIVTAAAALLAVVFIAFATSNISFIKMFGIGLALAVIMDATLIRGILVPAFMRLAGDANWWAPAPLRRLYERVGISDAEPEPEVTPDLTSATPRVGV
jgi:putative drug exporter of the RND superfamily